MLIVTGDGRDDDEVVAMSAILEHVTPVLGGWAQLVLRGSRAGGKSGVVVVGTLYKYSPLLQGENTLNIWNGE